MRGLVSERRYFATVEADLMASFSLESNFFSDDISVQTRLKTKILLNVASKNRLSEVHLVHSHLLDSDHLFGH